ncbi:hypothetical protein HUX88_12335 [Duganella sp. BJB1802]|uniref:hypothetical protein n=1 Tax=Duganella sp. BJB1802 TaxID=2744575 RepID=UPI0015949AB9|nr:hypothetical protein [Duganella sp. BJB1802]NVD71339.1 hypothetical protein [Duganella sp. BJB1802]
MRFKIIGLAALALFTSTVSHAAANGGASPDRVAGQFVDALQHQRFKEAAAMFAPEAAQNAGTQKRADGNLGGLRRCILSQRCRTGRASSWKCPRIKASRRSLFNSGMLPPPAMGSRCFTN